jgi:hypothetical protein
MRNLHEGTLGGTFQARYERDVFDEAVVNRLTQLDLGDAALVFGRIDRMAETPDGLEAFHIGRLAIADEESEPVVVDWRAPVAEPFYRATGREPMGLARRRHFAVHGRTLLGLEDELFGEGHLGVGHDDGLTDGLNGHARLGPDNGLRGYSTLLAALERGRTGQLGDIVATIQAEQDEIIRSPQAGVLVVQGGPGTGKTVVALHRAAYLLYTYRFPLEDQGVLVIGPNRVFLRYIDRSCSHSARPASSRCPRRSRTRRQLGALRRRSPRFAVDRDRQGPHPHGRRHRQGSHRSRAATARRRRGAVPHRISASARRGDTAHRAIRTAPLPPAQLGTALGRRRDLGGDGRDLA